LLGCLASGQASLADLTESFGDSVTISGSDSSRPAVQLEFDDPVTGNPVILHRGSTPLDIAMTPGDRFFALGVAQDPQGVKDNQVAGQEVRRCRPGSIDRNLNPEPFKNPPSDGGSGETATAPR